MLGINNNIPPANDDYNTRLCRPQIMGAFLDWGKPWLERRERLAGRVSRSNEFAGRKLKRSPVAAGGAMPVMIQAQSSTGLSGQAATN